ncbi:MAG TPA: glycosyltransferase [Gammaproteobacteria bacterium]|nr:glycosyltransferase [Gammaproteobacteria bacterium]
MIPKKINYIWLGEALLPPLIEKCLESWTRVLPDYEILRWDESNLSISDPFYEKAYQAKKWAFCADVARLHILYEQGGIYLDTDMEIIRDLSPLLDTDLFIGREDDHFINAGIVGCVPKNAFINDALQAVTKSLRSGYVPIPKVLTEVYAARSGSYRFPHKVYPPKYFYPYNPFVSDIKNLFFSDVTADTYAIHHWAHSWKGGLIQRARALLKRRAKVLLSRAAAQQAQ